jgi:hypothetical protein
MTKELPNFKTQMEPRTSIGIAHGLENGRIRNVCDCGYCVLTGVNGSWWELSGVNQSQRRLSAVNEGYRGLTIVIFKAVESRGAELGSK